LDAAVSLEKTMRPVVTSAPPPRFATLPLSVLLLMAEFRDAAVLARVVPADRGLRDDQCADAGSGGGAVDADAAALAARHIAVDGTAGDGERAAAGEVNAAAVGAAGVVAEDGV
jgi:hypothetical protein